MNRRLLRRSAAVLVPAALLPGTTLAGGEYQSTNPPERTASRTASAPAGSHYGMPPGQPYRFCIAYPYHGPGQSLYTPPSGMTHYAPGGGFVYPGYAYAGHCASGMGPGPFLTGGIVGLTLGAILF